jgi:Clp protease
VCMSFSFVVVVVDISLECSLPIYKLTKKLSLLSHRAKEILFTKASLNQFMADYCDQPVEKIAADTDRDFFMTPYEALDYGLIDEVLKTKTSHIPMPAMPSLRG